jgi:hypothetical protein
MFSAIQKDNVPIAKPDKLLSTSLRISITGSKRITPRGALDGSFGRYDKTGHRPLGT